MPSYSIENMSIAAEMFQRALHLSAACNRPPSTHDPWELSILSMPMKSGIFQNTSELS